ncbi:MAG: outer membrane protein assembly factor BamD [Lentisphaeria bacterium]|nr:outer membrane protein assembly factor BamD [Lentisphaeria bacterium]
MIRKIKLAGVVCLLAAGSFLLKADDAEAVKSYQEGLKLFNAKEYYDALKKFKDSELLAKSNTIRANSLRAQIGAAKMAELPWQEFELIEALLTRFPEYADVPASVKREYQLGDIFFKGKREPAFYAMRKIPWLTGPDKTADIYTQALKRAPYAPEAPAARLRLAFIYDQKGEVMKSLEQLRIVEREFSASSSYKLALLALGYGCYEMALRGDGDGRYGRECAEMSAKYLKLYPKDVAAPLVQRNLQRIRDAQARRLLDMAEFYRKQGRTEAAARYLARVIREFPESTSAPESESKLAALDKSFTPGDFPADVPRYIQYKTAELPEEAEKVLFFPGENGKHNLLPIPDLQEYLGREIKK